MEAVIDEYTRVFEQVHVNIRYSSLDKIKGLDLVSQEKLLESVGLIEGMEINPSRYKLLFQHLQSFPWIEEYSVESSIFPKRIQITVKEAKPKFVIEYEGQSWLMSEKGVLLESLKTITNPELIMLSSSLPRLYDDDPHQLGQDQTTLKSTTQRIKTALTMLEYLELVGGLPFTYSAISIMSFGELAFEVSGDYPAKRVYLLARDIGEARSKKGQLEAMISDLQKRSETSEVIDLRFEGQAIVR